MLERRKIEAMDNFAVAGIQEQRFIGIVTRNEQALFAAAHTNAQTGRIRNVPKLRAANFSARDSVTRRQRQESLRRNATVLKA